MSRSKTLRKSGDAVRLYSVEAVENRWKIGQMQAGGEGRGGGGGLTGFSGDRNRRSE